MGFCEKGELEEGGEGELSLFPLRDDADSCVFDLVLSGGIKEHRGEALDQG